MDYENLKNDNGVYLYEDHDCNTIAIEFCFNTPNNERQQAINAILRRYIEKSNQVISDVEVKAKELYYLQYNLGVQSIGNSDNFVYSINMVSPNKLGCDFFEEALEFIRDLLLKPDFTNEQLFERVKRNYLSELKYSLSDIDKKATRMYKAMVFNDIDSFDTLTDIEHITELIESITLEDIENSYKAAINDDSFYRGFVFGDITEEQFRKLREYMPFKSDKADINYKLPTTVTEGETEVVDPNTNESVVYVTYDIDQLSPEWAEIIWALFNGGGGICREILREKHGLVYASWASLYTKRNLLYIYAKIAKENKQKLLEGIDEVVALVQDPEQLKEYLEIGKDYIRKDAFLLSEKKEDLYDKLEDHVRGIDEGLDYNAFVENLDSYTEERVAGMMQTLRMKNVFMYRGDK